MFTLSHRITIKDVAREAGVSVATVSYVINNRTDLRISDATRKKVLQISNLLGYTPNQSAQALATSRKRMVALYVSPETSVLKLAEQMYLMNFLSSFFHEKNYGLTYLSRSFTERYDQAAAILCCDTPSEYFFEIGDRNFIPLLALDCMILGNGLFFQINSDYSRIAREAAAFFNGDSYKLISLTPSNHERKALIEQTFPDVVYIDTPEQLVAYRKDRLLVLDHSLYTLLADADDAAQRICYHPLISTEKAEALYTCMEYALSRTPDTQHDVRI